MLRSRAVAVALLAALSCAAFETNAVRTDVLADPAKAAALLGQLVPPDTNGDAQVRTAIAALTHYVQRPGAPEEEKRAWVVAVEKAAAKADATNSILLIEMLGLLGEDSSVAVLDPMLKDPARKDDARRALAWIGTPAANAALAKACGTAPPAFVATGTVADVCAALTALGQAGTADAEARLRAQLAAPRADVRAHVARILLGMTNGNAAARIDAVAAPANAPEVLLAFLDHAARKGTQADMPRVCALMAHGDAVVAAAAGEAAGMIATPPDVPRLVALLASSNAAEAAAARTALVRAKRGAMDISLAMLAGTPEAVTPALIEVAAARNCMPAAMPVTRLCASSNDALRTAAIAALASLATTGAMHTVLLPMIAGGADADAAAACSSFVVAAQAYDAAALGAMPLAATIAAAPPARKELLVSLLPCVGDSAALATAADAAASDAASVRRAAIRALGQWPDAAAVKSLASLAVSCADTERALAVRTLLDLAARTKMPQDQVAACIEPLRAVATTPTLRAMLAAHLGPELAPMATDSLVPLFNGSNFDGWVGDVKGYTVSNGMIVCERGRGGMLFTAEEFDNFHLKFQFKLAPGANNGLGIRTPLKGDPAYVGYEIQILDDTAPEYAKLEPGQYHGSLYKLIPAKRGHLKPVGEWNHEEVIAAGDHITVILNGVTIVDGDVAKFGRPERGHIGFLGHGSHIEFKAIEIKELPNIPPRGFTALFNGRDFAGWKGLVGNPILRAKMTPEALAKAQEGADKSMQAHWRAEDGVIVFDGKGDSLCTAGDYTNFEMFVDWKIKDKGDSGIYLRGSPQIQIWDTAQWPEGSGGIYNNAKHPKSPTVRADRPVGQWNTFRIRMTGECVSVWLNGTNVVDNVVMENYWDRSKPIFPSGQIELQNHGNTLYFRNIYLKELP